MVQASSSDVSEVDGVKDGWKAETVMIGAFSRVKESVGGDGLGGKGGLLSKPTVGKILWSSESDKVLATAQKDDGARVSYAVAVRNGSPRTEVGSGSSSNRSKEGGMCLDYQLKMDEGIVIEKG
ncbi:hypothetical protein Droror1_Dr00019980 [Drosera rotundifolia]